MKCDFCDGTLSIKQTYVAGSCKTQRAVCDKCGSVHTLVTVRMPSKKGRGAFAVANALRNQKMEVIVKERNDE